MSDFCYNLGGKSVWPDTENDMIEIGEKCDSGIHQVFLSGNHIGDIVKTDRKKWLSIPCQYGRHNRRITAHKLRRDAVSALN